jgi:ketosteroid isomerase-like protein
MTENKKTIEKYMEGFRKADHAMVLSCLTDDVVWDLPGYFHWVGKEAFDKEIENPAFKGRPEIEIVRMVEEGETVVAEGTVKGMKADGTAFRAAFCDVFLMKDAKIRRLTSYLMEVKP